MGIKQDKLVNQIKQLTLSNFPHSLILEGEYGAGKHYLCDIIQEHLNLDAELISSKLTADFVDEAMINPTPKLYIIEANEFNEKAQNSILKFIEEPLANSYIIILVENISQVLETVRNRCQHWVLEAYTREYIESLIDFECDKELVLSIARTPGKLELLKSQPLADITKSAKALIKNLKGSKLQHILVLVDKFDYGTASDKYNIQTYLDILLYQIGEASKTQLPHPSFLQQSRKIKWALQNIASINTYNAMLNFFITLWEEVNK